MKCIEFQAVLNDYVDGELSATEAARAESHLEGCAPCRSRVEALRTLLNAASALPREITPQRNLWREIETQLSQEQAPAETNRRRAPIRFPELLSWFVPLTAAAAIVFLATLSKPRVTPSPPQPGSSWTVASLAGAPLVGQQAVTGEAKLQIGQWIKTDARSRAKLAESSVGEVSVEPNSQLRLTTAQSTDHTLELKRGTLSAFIWAPPRLFFVDTPTARAVDLGCAYTMTVGDNGDGELHVTLGYVALEHRGREALIPAHAKCLTRRGYGPGTPFADDASAELRAALERFDFQPSASATTAVSEILAHARDEDAVTLWHLLARTSGAQRAKVFDKLVRNHPLPAGVTREGILDGDSVMRHAWGRDLGIGTL